MNSKRILRSIEAGGALMAGNLSMKNDVEEVKVDLEQHVGGNLSARFWARSLLREELPG